MSHPARRCLLAFILLLISAWSSAQAAQLSESDVRLYRAAFAAAKSGNWTAAWRDAGAAQDKLPGVALRWQQLSEGAGNVSFSDYIAFINGHPNWPSPILLRERAEGQLTGAPDDAVEAWFADHPPVTVAGRLREADLWLAHGRRAEADELIRKVWIESDFDRVTARSMRQRYHGVLRTVDDEARLARLLWSGQIEEAKRLLPHVPPAYQALGEARLALAALAPGAERLLARVPAALRRDPGLAYERLRWRRRKEHYDDAIALLRSLPRERDHPAAWAVERQILARYALAQGKPALAYRIASRNELTSGANFAELEFLAGWTALRFLHQPHTAYDHFVRLYDAATMPISIARGAYWAARAAEAMNYRQLAESWYDTAAKRITTYYGQLAAAHIGMDVTPALLAEPVPRSDEVRAFNGRDLVRVTHDLAEIGADDLLRPFLRRLSDMAVTPADHELVARLALDIERPDLAVAAAKSASYHGIVLLSEGYPLTALPSGGSVERPLLLAMTRQESAFDETAVSRAGARGLMQLLPATANLMARSLQMPFSLARLTSDRRYNLTLGRAYLSGLLGDFSGSYVLAIASYNAGPARVRQWMADYGDPRTKSVDVIDWIESIPVAETRNYIQRVLENLQVYRMRMGDHGLAFSLASDLRR